MELLLKGHYGIKSSFPRKRQYPAPFTLRQIEDQKMRHAQIVGKLRVLLNRLRGRKGLLQIFDLKARRLENRDWEA